MSEPVSPYLDERQASKLLNLPIMTLRRWRREGRGCPFRKFGSRVLYHREELLAWAEAQRRTSTHDAHPAAV